MPRRGAKNQQPPQLNAAPVSTMTLRYVASGNSSALGSPITVQDLYDTLCMATSATAAKRLISALRVRKIEMWGAPVSSSTATTNLVGIRDVSYIPLGGKQSIVFDQHLGADRPAHIMYRPDRQSLAGNWLASTNTSQLFLYNCSSGAVLDLTIDYVLGYQAGTAVMTTVGAAITGVLGVIYVRALDSNGASPLLVPSSLIYQTA